MSVRKCGTCNACCVWPSVEEINKPARTPCHFLEKQGFRCSIYETRPEACSKYDCSWLRGNGAMKDKPNVSGVLMDRRSTQFGVVLVAKSMTPGAVMSEAGQKAIKRTSKDEKLPCLITDNNDKIIGASGQPEFLEEVQRKGPELGDQKDWIQNILEHAGKGKIYPGLDRGR